MVEYVILEEGIEAMTLGAAIIFLHNRIKELENRKGEDKN